MPVCASCPYSDLVSAPVDAAVWLPEALAVEEVAAEEPLPFAVPLSAIVCTVPLEPEAVLKEPEVEPVAVEPFWPAFAFASLSAAMND